jgi:hypothetical protein
MIAGFSTRECLGIDRNDGLVFLNSGVGPNGEGDSTIVERGVQFNGGRASSRAAKDVPEPSGVFSSAAIRRAQQL